MTVIPRSTGTPWVARRSASTPARLALTDRGIAVILLAGALIVLAALLVVTVTAVRVTGDGQESPAAATARS